MANPTVRTTLTIPMDLLEAVDAAVREGRARSRNEMVALALRHEIESQRRAAIDEAFAAMASDEEYREEAAAIFAEFSEADAEAAMLAELGR